MKIAACIFSLMLLTGLAQGQADGCRGALSALNRVKEEITPQLSPQTEHGRTRLQVLQSTLERGTHVCPDFAELWYYRMVVSRRLGDAKETDYSQKKLDELQYESKFDPFSVPAAVLSPDQAVTARATKVRQKWALVVGIDRFKDSRVPGLHFAVKDSNDFVSFLKDPEGGRFQADHIFHLSNEDATLQGIRQQLGLIRAKAQPDDLVVVYLSSHGSPRGMDPNGVSYVVLHDTNLDDEATLYATSLQMIDLVQQINREVKAQRVILILDTCFSGDALTALETGAPGSGARGISVEPADPAESDGAQQSSFSGAFQNLKLGFGRAVITASRANEASWESPDLQNGYFTHYLIETLRASHGNDKLADVFSRVRDVVSVQVKNDRGATQTPSYQFSEGADVIVLGVQAPATP